MPENDDLLDPSEIEALLKSAGAFGSGGSPAPPTPIPTPPPAMPSGGGDSSDLLNANEIEALLKQRDTGPAASFSGPGPEALLNRAQQGLSAAMGGGGAPRAPQAPRAPKPPDPRLQSARPYAFQALENLEANADPKSLAALEEVELDLRIELGRAELLIEEVLKLREGSVVPLDKLAGDPVDILVNGRLVARGEVLVLNDNFCVRVAEILAPSMS